MSEGLSKGKGYFDYHRKGITEMKWLFHFDYYFRTMAFGWDYDQDMKNLTIYVGPFTIIHYDRNEDWYEDSYDLVELDDWRTNGSTLN